MKSRYFSRISLIGFLITLILNFNSLTSSHEPILGLNLVSKAEFTQSETLLWVEDLVTEGGTCADCVWLYGVYHPVWCHCATYTIYCYRDPLGQPDCTPEMWSGNYDITDCWPVEGEC
jgi:hypothetical protein